MKTLRFRRFIQVMCVALCSQAIQAAPLHDLYFGLDNMRGFAEVYWWFFADGRVLRDHLPSGLTPAGFEKACTADSGYCGRYTLAGDKLAIQYDNGKSETWTYKTLNGGIQLNYLILSPVAKYPPGTRLSGTWDKPFSTRAPGVRVTVPTFYTFKPDGTFNFSSTAGVESAARFDSTESKSSGTYKIQDYVLELVRDGKPEQHMIFPAPGGNLNIDGMVYKKQSK